MIPSLKKGAFLVGAEYGQGVVICRTGHGWSAPVFVRLAGGSFGFQIGGQATDLVLVAVNDHGLPGPVEEHSSSSGCGDVSAYGGTGGTQFAGGDGLEEVGAELLTYSRSKGLVCRY